eukprot:scaffold81736_cov29-Tisochrysis_lutea.AAC.3
MPVAPPHSPLMTWLSLESARRCASHVVCTKCWARKFERSTDSSAYPKTYPSSVAITRSFSTGPGPKGNAGLIMAHRGNDKETKSFTRGPK